LTSIATYLQLATAANLPDAESGLQSVNQDHRQPDLVILTDICLHPNEKMTPFERQAKKKSLKLLSLMARSPRNDDLVVEAPAPFDEEAAAAGEALSDEEATVAGEALNDEEATVAGEVLSDEGVVVDAGAEVEAEVEEEA
jgi:hypothetical protein